MSVLQEFEARQARKAALKRVRRLRLYVWKKHLRGLPRLAVTSYTLWRARQRAAPGTKRRLITKRRLAIGIPLMAIVSFGTKKLLSYLFNGPPHVDTALTTGSPSIQTSGIATLVLIIIVSVLGYLAYRKVRQNGEKTATTNQPNTAVKTEKSPARNTSSIERLILAGFVVVLVILLGYSLFQYVTAQPQNRTDVKYVASEPCHRIDPPTSNQQEVVLEITAEPGKWTERFCFPGGGYRVDWIAKRADARFKIRMDSGKEYSYTPEKSDRLENGGKGEVKPHAYMALGGKPETIHITVSLPVPAQK